MWNTRQKSRFFEPISCVYLFRRPFSWWLSGFLPWLPLALLGFELTTVQHGGKHLQHGR